MAAGRIIVQDRGARFWPDARGALFASQRSMAETQPAPKSIGRYQILAELGRGSMARVYLASDPNMDRKLALKVLDPKDLSSPRALKEMEKRFLIEATAAARLDHPAAVAIYDADVDPETGASYIAMEWVDGTSLKDRLSAGGPLPLAEAVDIAYQVAGALDAAHRQGLIHRDIKPANILINRQGRAKLSDFGIAKLDDLELTTTGQVLGTPCSCRPSRFGTTISMDAPTSFPWESCSISA